jgi:hypothetical protein
MRELIMTTTCTKCKKKISREINKETGLRLEAGFWLTLFLVIILFLVLKFSSCATDSYVLSMAAQMPPWAAEKTSSAKAERQYFFFARADGKAVHAVPPPNFYHEEHEKKIRRKIFCHRGHREHRGY